MINDVDIGHAPIISPTPIFASPDFQRDDRYFARIMHGMGRQAEPDYEAIGARVRVAREEAGLNQTELGERIGLKQPSVAELERGQSKSWPKHAVAISKALGKPRGYFEPDEEHIGNTPDLPPEVDRSGLGQVVAVPEYDVRLSAGPGFINDEESVRDVWQFSRRYLVDEMRLHTGHLAVVTVEGDSMEPTLRSGDRVLVDHADRNPARPGVFAVWDSDATVVKRLERVPASDPPMVTLLSDNKNHKEYTVPADLVNVIGRVVWVARRL